MGEISQQSDMASLLWVHWAQSHFHDMEKLYMVFSHDDIFNLHCLQDIVFWWFNQHLTWAAINGESINKYSFMWLYRLPSTIWDVA